MTAGDADTAPSTEMMGGEVEYRCWHHTDINNITTGLREPLGQGLNKGWARQASVTTDGDSVLLACTCLTANRVTDPGYDRGRQRCTDNPTNIVGFEYFGWELHYQILAKATVLQLDHGLLSTGVTKPTGPA